LAEQDVLQGKVQELEIYINGRHDRWSALNAELAAHKDALHRMENALLDMDKTVRARDAVIAHHDEEKRQLAASMRELERQCSELAGRRKEREEAYDELQKKLAAHVAQAEQLKIEYASRTKETELAGKNALDTQHRIESLEGGIKRRDTDIDALKAEVEQAKLAARELTSAKTALGNRVDDLEKGLAEREQQLQALRDDLRMSRDQQRLDHEHLSERTAQLASTQEALEQKSRLAERLSKEQDAAQKESVRIRAELDTLSAHAVELGRLRGEALAETDQVKLALAAQQELVAKLETELRAKRVAADMLERSVSRITDLGASLAALDQHMNGSGDGKRHVEQAAPHPGDFAAPHSGDFAATLAADDRLQAAAPASTDRVDELLPMDLLLDDEPNRNVVDIGERTEIEASRKLVVTIHGQSFDYPISKKHMTIGRSHSNDIRIASHFVSRVHATVSTNGAATIIEDAGSRNGVLVNSERVRRRVLHDGDVVTVGDDSSLRFVDATR
ncbi:MAG TPA: FHA domain-containing protein, partial [Gammaproteobacteria bacterium]|nr:FHA domain-containing protein [Gammaproteobacteria bacterium]